MNEIGRVYKFEDASDDGPVKYLILGEVSSRGSDNQLYYAVYVIETNSDYYSPGILVFKVKGCSEDELV